MKPEHQRGVRRLAEEHKRSLAVTLVGLVWLALEEIVAEERGGFLWKGRTPHEPA